MELQYRYLRVPIQLDCFPVYKETKHFTNTLAGQLVEFSMLPHRGDQDESLCIPPRLSPNISEDLIAKPFEATSKPLEEGIHLHWTLPKALRTAVIRDQKDGTVETHYRQVPNRWMIKRKVKAFIAKHVINKETSEEEVKVSWTSQKDYEKTFVLESDLLSKENPGNSNAFPYKPKDFSNGDFLYRYIGKVWNSDEFINYQSSEDKTEPTYLDNLTALGYGEPLFSAYYPECRNVFGFHDDLRFKNDEGELVSIIGHICNNDEILKQIPNHYEDKLAINYELIGWYSDPEKDPFFRGEIKRSDNEDLYLEDKLGAAFDWKIVVEGEEIDLYEESINGRSLYCGQINCNIDEKTEYLKDKEGHPAKPGSEKNLSKTKIAIGNTPGQALAALLANTTNSGVEAQSAELMLDAMQLGLLSHTDSADLIAKIDHGMHQAAFQPEEGGHKWQFGTHKPEPAIKEKSTFRPETMPDEKLAKYNDLLTELNKKQSNYDKLRFNIRDEQIQLYADWYKYMITEYNLNLGSITRDNKVNEVRQYLGRQMKVMVAQFSDLENLDKAIIVLTNEIKDGFTNWSNEKGSGRMKYELIKKPVSRYWSPAEPAILFFGENIEHDKRYHKEERPSAKIFTAEYGLSKFNLRAVEQISAYFETSELYQKIFDFTPQQFDGISWSPLLLDWQVKLTPVTKNYDKKGNQIPWKEDAVLSKFELRAGEIDLMRKESADVSAIPDSNKLQIFEGRSILTPGAHRPLLHAVEEGLNNVIEEQEQLKNELAEETSEEDKTRALILEELSKNFGQIKNNISSLKVLSQNLSGLNDAFAMHKQILQLKVFDPLADNVVLDELTNKLLNKIIGPGNKVSPLPSNLFLPIRDGWMRISKLRLVDCFGQFSQWDHEDHILGSDGSPDVIIAESLKPQGHEPEDHRNSAAYLPPRLTQPTRINFSLQSATDDGLNENNLGFNPICGWLLPNYLERSIFIYDEHGIAQGQLRARISAGSEETIVWVPTPGQNDLGPLNNPVLKNFVSFFKKQPTSYLHDYIRVCFESQQNIDPENFASFTGVNMLMGHPLALVQASINLELKGTPLKNQSWESRMNHFLFDNPLIENREPYMDFDMVKFPIHLGDVSQSNDGLVGFYLMKQHRFDSENPNKSQPQISFEEFYSNMGKQAIEISHAEYELLNFKKVMSQQYFDLTIEKNKLSDEEHSLLNDLRMKGDTATKNEFNRIRAFETRERNMKEVEAWFNTYVDEINRERGNRKVEVNIYKAPLPHDMFISNKDKNVMGNIAPHKTEVLLLMDPRAKVHLTSGILPVKTIQLNSETTAKALNKIETAFLTTPVLSPKDQIVLPTIKDDEIVWSWLERTVITDTVEDVVDNLKKIKGIGKKIEAILNEVGIKTYKQLADTSPDYIHEILLKAGDHFKRYIPTTWPAQAKMIYEESHDPRWDFLEPIRANLKKTDPSRTSNWKEYPSQKIVQPIEAFVPFDDNLILKEGWLKINSKTANNSSS